MDLEGLQHEFMICVFVSKLLRIFHIYMYFIFKTKISRAGRFEWRWPRERFLQVKPVHRGICRAEEEVRLSF